MFIGTSRILSVVGVAHVDSLAEPHVGPISLMYRKLPSMEVNHQLQCELARFRDTLHLPQQFTELWRGALVLRVLKPEKLDRLRNPWRVGGSGIDSWQAQRLAFSIRQKYPLNEPSKHTRISFCGSEDPFAKMTSPPCTCDFGKFWILGITYLAYAQLMFQ